MSDPLRDTVRQVRQDLAYRPIPHTTEEFVKDWNRLADAVTRIFEAYDASELGPGAEGDQK